MNNIRGFLWFSGRSPRQTYWLTYLCFFAVSLVMLVLFFVLLVAALSDSPQATALGLITLVLLYGGSLVMGWIGLAVSIRRYHDRNKTAWWVLIGLIPLIGAIWQIIELGFLSGTEGSNRYGPDPRERGQ